MASELTQRYSTASGLTTVYALLLRAAQYVTSASGALQTASAANRATSAISCLDTTEAYRYIGSVPANTPAGHYDVEFYLRLGSSPAATDTLIGVGVLDWNGSAEVSTANLQGTSVGPYELDHDGGRGLGGAAMTVDGVTSTTDILRYTSRLGTGIMGVTLRAYLKSDYDANVRNVLGVSTTGSDGRWNAPIFLSSGTYYIAAAYPGDQVALATVVVP